MRQANTQRRTATGAAHFGAPMFGARGPLLAPEGDGSSGGGPTSTTITGTSGDASSANTNGSSGTAPAGGGGEKLLTQEQVNTLVAQARREGRESAARQTGGNNGGGGSGGAAPAAAAAAAPAPMTPESVQQIMQRERAFTRAISSTQISPTQLARMERAFAADNPPDVNAWASSYLADMGIAAPSNTSNSNGTTTAGSTSPAQHGMGAAAPTAPGTATPTTQGGVVDIWNLSVAQLEELGPEGIRREHEKILAQANRMSGAPPIPRVGGQKR